MLTVIKRTSLNFEELQEVKALEHKCISQSSEQLSFDWALITQKSSRKSSLLVYQHGHLIAYCRYFLFYQKVAEVLLYAKRSELSSLFEVLSQALRECLLPMGVNTISIQSDFLGDEFLKARGFVLAEVELSMEKMLLEPCYQDDNAKLPFRVRLANESDLEAILVMERMIFKDDNFINQTELIEQLESPDRDIVIVEQGSLLAKMHLNYQSSQAVIQNLCVDQLHQRQGLATLLIATGERFCQERGLTKLSLSVDKANHKAVSLYKKAGFCVAKEQLYWHKRLESPIF